MRLKKKKEEEYFLWIRIGELRDQGLNISQVAKVLNIHRQKAARLYNLSEDKLRLLQEHYHTPRPRILDIYETSIVSCIEYYPYYSSAQIHEYLKEHHPRFPYVCDKTVYNYVQYIRKKYNMPRIE